MAILLDPKNVDVADLATAIRDLTYHLDGIGAEIAARIGTDLDDLGRRLDTIERRLDDISDQLDDLKETAAP